MVCGDVVILTGPPGAGKSTVARSVASSFGLGVHLRTDDFWHAIVAGGIPPFLPESHSQNETVMQVIRQAAFAFAAGGFTTVVDGVVGSWMLHHSRVPEGADAMPWLHYVVLRPSLPETLRRATSRTDSEALADSAQIVSLWQQFADLGEWEPHAVDTTALTPAETAAVVRTAIDEGTQLLDRSVGRR